MEESITINELSIKAKSKNEIYRLRATERKNYLPPTIKAITTTYQTLFMERLR